MPFASPYTSYEQILRDLTDNAMTVARSVAEAVEAGYGSGLKVPHGADLLELVRTFSVLSALVRRAIVVSNYIETLPAPAEQRDGKLMSTLDGVIALFAEHKIDADTYRAIIDEEIEDEAEDARLHSPEGDVVGRRPVVLVAELCRDFGVAAHPLPGEWLAPVPHALRQLCARAAAAAIRPAIGARRIGHLMER